MLTVNAITPSRRELLRLAGACPLAIILSRLETSPARAQTPFPSRVRVLHASPALGKIEVHINGQEELDEFTYGKVSDWIEVPPGTARITMHCDRAGINYVVYDAYVPIVPDEDYDLIIADPLLSEPTLLPVQVDRSPLRAGLGRLSLIHASVALPGLDITGPNDRVQVTNLQFGQLSEPLQVPAANYELEVRSHESGQVVLQLQQNVEAGKVYHIVIFGDPGSAETPVTSAALVDEARTSATSTPTS